STAPSMTFDCTISDIRLPTVIAFQSFNLTPKIATTIHTHCVSHSTCLLTLIFPFCSVNSINSLVNQVEFANK
ncbi:hypothetical protein CAPTEDRAFT_135764, partial [Capitella teleta]